MLRNGVARKEGEGKKAVTQVVKEGDRVKLFGLTSDEGLQLNGKCGIIMEK